jgi:selenocysteine-specific elongation factor
MYVIGTAGHVDHGKSTLVQALTGIDPDRWEEEKRRGLTIDLGFAWLTLPSGEEVSIVDVPGHERFIKNMLAGVGGIDLALLVIAADEGVMPQTREHLAIIDLLGIERGVVALTKADLVSPEFLELAEADVREALIETTLEDAAVIACSGATRVGLEELLAAVESELAKTERRRDRGRPRLPVDRAFTMTGFGTVVTGTLIDGSLRVGDEIEVSPGRAKARVRGLQTHGQKVEVAPPGRRTAVNLTGVAVDDLHRGMVLAHPGSISATTAVDVRMRAVTYISRPVRHNLTVTFHTGSAEVEGKLLLLDAKEVPPGGEAWAQVRLTGPVVALRGDRFIIRDPNDTLGGGAIIDTNVPRHRRFDPKTIARLQTLERGSPEDALLTAISGSEPVATSALETEPATIEALVERGAIVRLRAYLYSKSGFEAVSAQVREALTGYHTASPLRPGMPREELRSRLGLGADAYDALVELLAEDGAIAERGNAIASPEHEPALDSVQEAAAAKYIEALRVAPYSPPTDRRPDEDILAFLEARGEVVNAGDGVVFAADAYAAMVQQIEEQLRDGGKITLAHVRDMFGTTRKYAQALLEHLDAKHITRRVGDERVLHSGK